MNEIKSKETVEKKSLIDEIQNQPYKAPLVNITEDENSFFIIADLPGVRKDNVELKIEENSLSIIGKVDFDKNAKSKFILREKRTGNYLRSFKLGDSIDQEKIEATLENGQLLLMLPKKESVKPRSIEIN